MSNLANYVLDRTIDYIENRARDNEVRDAYANYMSDSNWNNQEMAKVIDIICIFLDDEIGSCRDERDENALIKELVTTVVNANCGAFAISDRRISDNVPDNVYSDLKRADGLWFDMVGRAEDAARGRNRGGRDRRDRDDRNSRGRDQRGSDRGRSVFDRSRAYGQSGTVFDRSEVDDQRQASNSVFSRSIEPAFEERANSRERDREERRPTPQQQPQSQRSGFTREPEPLRQEEQQGPDLSAKRPYDNFWMNGENWQIAYRSKFVWTSTAAQRARRTFNPYKEVAFLVKNADGVVREEFLPVTKDLEEEAHVIRSQNRPFMRRTTTGREDRDPASGGVDLDDIVGLDHERMEDLAKKVPKLIAAEVLASFRASREQTTSVTTIEEAVVKASAEACKNDCDVNLSNNILSVQLPGDSRSNEALTSIKALASSDGDLLQLQRRLKSLRGTLVENVLQYIDRHFTTEVNTTLRDQFGMSTVKIGSFIEDFEDLLNCNTFAKEGPSFANQFLSRTRLLLGSLQYLVEADLREQFNDCADLIKPDDHESQEYKDYCNNLVILFKPLSVVHVRMVSSGLGFVDNVVRAPSRTGPDGDLAELLSDLYNAGRELTGAGQVVLVTADNLVYELVPIGARREEIGIRTLV